MLSYLQSSGPSVKIACLFAYTQRETIIASIVIGITNLKSCLYSFYRTIVKLISGSGIADFLMDNTLPVHTIHKVKFGVHAMKWVVLPIGLIFLYPVTTIRFMWGSIFNGVSPKHA